MLLVSVSKGDLYSGIIFSSILPFCGIFVYNETIISERKLQMKRIILFSLALLILTGCGAKEQPVETTAVPVTTEVTQATQIPTEPDPTGPSEPTLPTFEECRVLSYYFQEPIPYQYYQRWGEIEIIKENLVHIRVYDIPYYKGDSVQQLAPGDILVLGNREIVVERVETNNTYDERSTAYVINGGEGRDGVWLWPKSIYDTELKKMVTDYYPKNAMAWNHYVLVDEIDQRLTERMNLLNSHVSHKDIESAAFMESLSEEILSYAPHGIVLDMSDSDAVQGRLEGVFIMNGIDSQTDKTMIPPGLEPVSPERLHFLMTGVEP